jgi:type I restriction enzyme S subunit
LGRIPKGWSIQSLYNSANFINGGAFKSSHFSEKKKGLPIVKIAELKNGITPQTKFTIQNHDEKCKINSGEILLSWSGNPDTSIGTFIWTGGSAWLNQHIFRVVPYKDKEKYYIYFLLKYLRPTLAEIARNKQTTGLGHFTATDMKRLKIVKPKKENYDEFERIAGSLYEKLYHNLIESKSLGSIRNTLLSKLISGELQVKKYERIIN